MNPAVTLAMALRGKTSWVKVQCIAWQSKHLWREIKKIKKNRTKKNMYGSYNDV